jgi:hypothetical protein
LRGSQPIQFRHSFVQNNPFWEAHPRPHPPPATPPQPPAVSFCSLSTPAVSARGTCVVGTARGSSSPTERRCGRLVKARGSGPFRYANERVRVEQRGLHIALTRLALMRCSSGRAYTALRSCTGGCTYIALALMHCSVGYTSLAARKQLLSQLHKSPRVRSHRITRMCLLLDPYTQQVITPVHNVRFTKFCARSYDYDPDDDSWWMSKGFSKSDGRVRRHAPTTLNGHKHTSTQAHTHTHTHTHTPSSSVGQGQRSRLRTDRGSP